MATRPDRHPRRRPRRARKRRRTTLPASLEQVNLHAAGIDIGSRSHWVCVPQGSSPDGKVIKEFGAFTADLMELARWLGECGVTTVAMESTGVYWIPLYELLDEMGFEVHLVDPRRLKNVPGRKSDVLDCQWLQQLHTYGLLAGAFRPSELVCALRSYQRQRDMLVRSSTRHVQHMQKALTQMNIKLREVLREVTGKTGMEIIRAILGGERDSSKLASLRNHRCANDEATIAKALQGTWREEHLFALRQAVEQYDFCAEQIHACDQEIEKALLRFENRGNGETVPRKLGKACRRNESTIDLRFHLFRMTGVDLAQIEGIDELTALKIISEIGPDVSAWPTVKHFCSWLGLAPGTKITGGKVLSGRTKPCANRVATALRISARSLWRSNSAVGAFLRRKSAHLGKPKAITATAHKLARLVYYMLKYGMEYVVRSQQQYEEEHRQRMIRNLKRRAKEFGLQIVDPHCPQHLAQDIVAPT
jgi:transposase